MTSNIFDSDDDDIYIPFAESDNSITVNLSSVDTNFSSQVYYNSGYVPLLTYYDNFQMSLLPDQEVLPVVQLYNPIDVLTPLLSEDDCNPVHLTADNVNKIKILSYSENSENGIFNQECPICLESFQDDTMCRVLNCKHAFHIDCIDPWLLGTKTNEISTNRCPTCNKNIDE